MESKHSRMIFTEIQTKPIGTQGFLHNNRCINQLQLTIKAAHIEDGPNCDRHIFQYRRYQLTPTILVILMRRAVTRKVV